MRGGGDDWFQRQAGAKVQKLEWQLSDAKQRIKDLERRLDESQDSERRLQSSLEEVCPAANLAMCRTSRSVGVVL